LFLHDFQHILDSTFSYRNKNEGLLKVTGYVHYNVLISLKR